MVRYWVVWAVVGLIVGLVAVAVFRPAGSELGKSVPDFALPRLKMPEQTFKRSDLKGEVTILNVWATWCVPCRQEHGTLLQMARSGRAPIYSLNYKDRRELAIRWLEQLGDPFVATGFDASGTVAHALGVRGVPETYILDANGVVAYRRSGLLTPEVWSTEVLPRLEQLRGG